jgi:hypothetical protein
MREAGNLKVIFYCQLDIILQMMVRTHQLPIED